MNEEKTIMDYDTVALDEEKNALVIIDQTTASVPYGNTLSYNAEGNMECNISSPGKRSTCHRCCRRNRYISCRKRNKS